MYLRITPRLNRLTTYIACLVIIGCLTFAFNYSSGQDELTGADFDPVAFEFVKSKDSRFGPEQLLKIGYEDGRILLIRTSAVAVAEYMPESWAKAQGMSHPYLALQSGSRTFRIDLVDNETSRQLYETIFEEDFGAKREGLDAPP